MNINLTTAQTNVIATAAGISTTAVADFIAAAQAKTATQRTDCEKLVLALLALWIDAELRATAAEQTPEGNPPA